MEDGTGMGHATVSRALKTLKERGLVSLIETDFKRGNLWKISNVALTGGSPRPRRRRAESAAAQTEVPQIEPAVASNRTEGELDSSELLTQIEQEFKNYKNLKNLSQESRATLLSRLGAITAPSKRRSEAARLDSLIGIYPESDLCAALKFLDDSGTLNGEKCHSPFSYLTVAGDEVMRRLPAAPSLDLGPKTTGVEDDELDTEIRERALERFNTELSATAQIQLVQAFVETEYPHGFLPPAQVVRSLAAIAWARGSTEFSLQRAG